jgi:hypothetical protein
MDCQKNVAARGPHQNDPPESVLIPLHLNRLKYSPEAPSFDECISNACRMHCSDQTVVGFFHKQGYQEKLIERLHQAIDVLNNPKKTRKTACIATLL